jgi:hypothetical protein
MLSKQSIRGSVQIIMNDELTTKDELITLSESWTEKEEILFRKMLKQGGKFGIQGNKFTISLEEKILTSKGTVDAPITPMDTTNRDVDLNYLR